MGWWTSIYDELKINGGFINDSTSFFVGPLPFSFNTKGQWNFNRILSFSLHRFLKTEKYN